MSVLDLVKVFEMMVANAKGRMGEVEKCMAALDKVNMELDNTNGMFG